MIVLDKAIERWSLCRGKIYYCGIPVSNKDILNELQSLQERLDDTRSRLHASQKRVINLLGKVQHD